MWTAHSIQTGRDWHKTTGLQVYVEDVPENPRCFVGATKFSKANGKRLENLPIDCVEEPPEDFVQDKRVNKVVHVDRMAECIKHLHPEYTNERIERMVDQVRRASSGEKRARSPSVEEVEEEEEEEEEELEPAAPPRKQHSPPMADRAWLEQAILDIREEVREGNRAVVAAVEHSFDLSVRREQLSKYVKSDVFKLDAENFKKKALEVWAKNEGRARFMEILETKRADYERRAEEQARREIEPRIPEIRARVEAEIKAAIEREAAAKPAPAPAPAPQKSSMLSINDEDFDAFDDLILNGDDNPQ